MDKRWMECENDRSEGKGKQHHGVDCGGVCWWPPWYRITIDIVLLCVKKHCDTIGMEAAVQGITRDDTSILLASV